MPRNKSGFFQKRPSTKKNKKSKKLPVKRTINLAQAGVQTLNIKAAVAGILLIVVVAAIFSKFFVVDRLTAMGRAEAQAESLRTQLADTYSQINSYGDLVDEYAHYTYSGMTDEEKSLVDRPSVIAMVQKEAESMDDAVEWSLSGNILTLNISGRDLQDINLMAKRLEAYPLVNICTVTTAAKDGTKTNQVAGGTTINTKDVRASIIVYLQNPETTEGEGQTEGTEQAAGEGDAQGAAEGEEQ